jgi:signal transduction histidine kinase/DNA-binding response OmpR family regulator
MPDGAVPKVLLVDDRPENLLSLEASLDGLECEMVRALSGPEALRHLLDEDFALILLDVQLPGMDGFETARLIRSRERSSRTPIIFITAINKTQAHVSHGYSVGAVDYILKPYDVHILRSKVERLLELSLHELDLRSELDARERERHAALELNAELERRVLERTIELEAANTELRIEMALRERGEAQRRTQNAVWQILAEARSVAEATPRLLAAIAENADWDFAAMWEVEEATGRICCRHCWRGAEGDLDAFEADTRVREFPVGEGLPGQVWRQGRPVWLRDAVEEENFPRRSVAARVGLHGGFAFPILLGDSVLGVLEFFSLRVREKDLALLTALEGIGSQIGQFVERMRAAQALQEADQRKDEFLAMLAHELRNPLTPITNAVRLLQERGDTHPEAREYQEIIERQARQMRRLVDDLLDVSRITRGTISLRPERVDLRALVATVAEDYQASAEHRGLDLRVALPPGPCVIEADPSRLRQVTGNLLSNAIRFTPAGGSVSISLAVESGSPEGESGAPQSEAVLRVRDTGIGIPPELLPRVFDTFVQGDRSLARSEGGLGIGLTLVKQLVELHGGRTAAASDGPGCGSLFEVRIPIVEGGVSPLPEMAAGEEQPSPQAAPIRNSKIENRTSKRVLLIDDNADALATHGDLLELWGHEVRLARNGPEGLAAAAEFQPDVIFLDIGLPVMDGYEVARRLRTGSGQWSVVSGQSVVEAPGTRPEDPHPPTPPPPHTAPPGVPASPIHGTAPARAEPTLVALTGYGQEEDRRRAVEAGFDLHLTKPVDPNELRRLLSNGQL